MNKVFDLPDGSYSVSYIQERFEYILQKPETGTDNPLISDCNWTQTHNHLVRKRTLNHLAKLTK